MWTSCKHAERELCLYHFLWNFYANTYIFLHFVCIILCEIFILTKYLNFSHRLSLLSSLHSRTFSALCLYHPLWDFYSNTAVSYLQFSALCLYHPLSDFYSNILILTLLCHTYIFLHFVCIILCKIFIATKPGVFTNYRLYGMLAKMLVKMLVKMLTKMLAKMLFVSSFVRFLF